MCMKISLKIAEKKAERRQKKIRLKKDQTLRSDPFAYYSVGGALFLSISAETRQKESDAFLSFQKAL